jgi:hypothetical protein
VNLAVSTNSASEEDETIVTVSANTSSAVFGDQTVDLSVSGAGIDGLDYVLSNTTITILNGQTSGSVTFTISDDGDIEGLETATLTISNPSSGMDLGTNLSEDINITDNDFDNFLPTIELSASTTNYLDGGNSGIASPYYISGVIADFTDPASTLGLDFTVADVETDVNSLVVSATSSNTSVVSNANLIISGFGATRNLQIVPSAVGNTTISVSVFDGIQSANYILNYSASQRTPDIDPSNTAWHTGISDASNSVGIDDTYFIAGDDELNVLNVYSRTESGLPYASFTYTSFLSLPEPGNPEVDLEAVAKSPVTSNRIFWTGSMSNGKSPFPDKPNRDRLFALDVTGTGSSTNFSFAGYTDISASLLAWGDANGYNFTTSAQAGVDSKAVDGFAVEGMVFGPDNTTLYVGMRAPLVPTATRTNAVIAPIQNFEAWFNNGSPVGMPTFGSPIELDLNLRGIRDIQRLSNGTYVIIAGSPTDTGSSDIYKWSGYPSDSPILVSSGGTVLNMEGIMQVNNGVNPDLTKVQVVSDGGTVVLYGDGIEAKDQGELNLRKFRSDVLTGLDLDICSEFTVTVEASGSTTLCDGETVELAAIGGTGSNTYLWSTGATTTSIVVGTSGNYSVTVTNLAGCSDVASVDVIVNAPSTWYLDADGDGYHVSSIVACVSPGPEYTLTSVLPNDCDDINPAANPGVSEDFCNGIDDDCDGLIDEGRIDGCTDALACNYNELSTCDDSSCEYATCADDDNDGLSNAEEIILGTNPNDNDSDNDGAFDGVEVNTYASNPLLQDTDGDGLTDGAEINSSLTSPTDTDTNDNGCSDFADLLGACDILGCTYEDAINYNALATIDDGTCTFPSGDSCPGDFDASGFVNTTDLLIFLTNYGSTCP